MMDQWDKLPIVIMEDLELRIANASTPALFYCYPEWKHLILAVSEIRLIVESDT